MEPIQYLRTIRRRWVLILACFLIGAGLGAAAGLGHKKSSGGTTYYRATCVLYYDESSVSDKGGAFTALSQMGLLATTGDVPAQIAQAQHTDAPSLVERILSVTDPSQATIRLTAVGTSAKETNALADAWCTSLAKYVNAKNTKSFTDSATRWPTR